MDYKKFLIQQLTYDGTTYTSVGNVVDTYKTFKVVCQECPFKLLPEPKEPAKRDWLDEDGEDVYIPTGGFKFKSYELAVKFLYVGKKSAMKQDLKTFVDFLYGRNTGGKPLMAVYDEYTQIGRRGLYVKDVDNELLFHSDSDTDVIAQFKVTFVVTDPVTEITLSLPANNS